MQLPPAVNALRQTVESMRQEGRIDEAFEALLTALALSETRAAELQLLLKKYRAASRGATSEQVSAEQLSLLAALLAAATPEQSEPNVESELQADAALDKEIDAAEAAQPETREKRRRTRNAAIRLDSLEVVDTYTPIPEEMAGWAQIGEEVVSRLRYRPARFYREDIHTPVLKDPSSDQDSPTIVALSDTAPATLVPGSIAGPDVIAALVVAKYERHCPLHRFHRAVLADQGLNLPVSTLCDWAAAGGDACIRLADALAEPVLSSWLLRMDATGLKVLDEGPDGIHRGTIWCYVGQPEDPDKPPDVVFRYTVTGEGAPGPWSFLAGRTGYLQADALNTHDRLFNGGAASAIEVGCNAHALRKLKALLPDEPRAAYPVQLLRRAYRLETLADAQCLHGEARTAFRQERTRPLLEQKLKPYLSRLVLDDNPTSELRKAAQYYLKHWTALTRFLEDGRLPLDNNFVESQLRAIRLGENNYLFAGSDAAAARTAAILSVLATAKAHRLNTHDYLTDVFTRLAEPATKEQVSALLPGAWKAAHA